MRTSMNNGTKKNALGNEDTKGEETEKRIQ